MDETRAIARLAYLAIEIRHRRLPEEQAEQLAVSLRATPSFEAFAQVLERAGSWPWLALQPWLFWAQLAQAAWQPWLAACGAAPGAPGPPRPADDRQRPPQGRSRLPM
jgi:hypothetical protein